MTKLAPLLIACALAGALSACHRAEEENVQVRAENASRALEQRYNALEAEAEDSTNAAIAPLDNETEQFLLQADNGAANASANGQ